MTELGPAAAPPSKDELLAQLKPELKRIISESVDADTDPEKVWQYANARRNYLMYRGIQHLAPVMDGNGFTDFRSVGGIGDQDESVSYNYTQNIFRGYGRKFTAVLGQRAPNVKAMPDDPDDELSVRATRAADTCNGILNSWWQVDERNLEVANKLWTTGPAFIYTPWNADGLLYGFKQEPKIKAVPQDLGGGETTDVPQDDGIATYPNGQVECHICDVFRVTTPFRTTDLKTCPWLTYEYEVHKGKLLAAYPQLRKMNLDAESASGISQTGREARDSTISPTGYPIRKSSVAWTYTRRWFQPWMYELVSNDERRKMFYDNFPTGVKITQVQGEIIALDEEKLDELWSAVKPETSETLNGDAIGQDMVSTQILTNHGINIGAETIERGIPMTLADPRVFNMEQWNRRPSTPCEIFPALPAVGDNLSESFFALPPARFSDQMMPFIAGVESGSQTVCGIQPEIFGGGDPAPTAREAEIRKNAALAQLGSTWTFIRKGWERAKLNGVRQLAKYGPGIVREGQLMVELSELTNGGWHFEADEAIPASWGQMRDLVMFMMDKPPAVLEAWGFNRPENITRNKALLGMSGYYTPGEDDSEKTADTIQQLLQGKPIQKQNPDGSTDIQPSIPADDFEDNHPLVVQLVQGWCQGKSGRKEKQQNPDGYANVVAFGKAHAVLANPAPPPAPLPPPKLSVTAAAKDLAPEVTDALFKDFKLDVPQPPPMPPGAPSQGPAPMVQ